MIQIKLDKSLDEEIFTDFWDFNTGGINFQKKITKFHPDINLENYKEYIKDFYKTNEELLSENVKDLQNAVNQTSDTFFFAVKDLFKEDFSNKDYVGAISIFDCNPRFVDKKLFQIFYKRDTLGKLEVVYHEILHFVFFDFCNKYCKEIVKDRDVNNGSYWALSEILNVLILNRPEFQAILKQPELLFYPSLKSVFPEIEKLWNIYNEDIPVFVKKSLLLLDDVEKKRKYNTLKKS